MAAKELPQPLQDDDFEASHCSTSEEFIPSYLLIWSKLLRCLNQQLILHPEEFK